MLPAVKRDGKTAGDQKVNYLLIRELFREE